MKKIYGLSIQWPIAVLIIIVVLVSFPRFCTEARYFDASNYFQVVGGVIAGLLTTLALAWQFAYEREKERTKDIRLSRVFFTVNHWLYSLNKAADPKAWEKLSSCYSVDENCNSITCCHDELNYFVLRLQSNYYVTNCKVKTFVTIEGDEGSPIKTRHTIGVVAPSQMIAVPFSDGFRLANANGRMYEHDISLFKRIEIYIDYTTQTGEDLVHSLIFDDGLWIAPGIETLKARTDNYVVFESASKLFGIAESDVLKAGQ